MRPIGKKMPWTCGDSTSAVDETYTAFEAHGWSTD